MGIRTRQGDDGTTPLLSGVRIRKDDARLEACGTIDELNCALGRALCWTDEASFRRLIVSLQDALFRLNADLADPDFHMENALLKKEHLTQLDAWIDEIETLLPRPKGFILPNGTQLATELQVARTICRRAERRVCTLCHSGHAQINPAALPFLNGLGDLLFLMARDANRRSGTEESVWKSE